MHTNVKDANGWISVDKKLPERMVQDGMFSKSSQKVLIYVTWYSETDEEDIRHLISTGICYETADGRISWEDNENVNGDYEEVTHWQPLPEPPLER